MEKNKLPFRSLLLLNLLATLSPMMRLLPRLPAALSGRAAWLSVLLAAPGVLLYALMLADGFRGGPGGMERFRAAWGPRLGTVPGLLTLLWLLLLLAYGVRASAERLISTVFNGGKLWCFCLLLALMAAVGGRGSLKQLARSAGILGCLLLLGLLPLLIPALGRLRPENLLPVTAKDLGPALVGAAPVLSLLSLPAFLLLLADEVEPGERRTGFFFGLMGLGAALLVILCTVGTLSAALAAKLQYPFFIMIRGLRLFGSLERLEAVVLGLWVMSDFACLSEEVLLIRRLLGGLFHGIPERASALIAALSGFGGALLLGSRALYSMERGAVLVMAGNLIVTLLLVPVTEGRLRKRDRK